MEANIERVREEIKRRLSIFNDELKVQSPEDLKRNYRLIGRQEAFSGLLKWIDTCCVEDEFEISAV